MTPNANLQYIEFDQYARIKAINFSTLKEMKRSPLHYKYRLEHERADSAGLRRGRAAHTAILDPDRFLIDYVMFKGKDRRSKKFKEFAKLHEGQTVLLEKEYAQALAIRDAIRGNKAKNIAPHEAASELLSVGAAEQSITWTDPSTGLKCKSRLDWNGPAIVEIKTTSSVNARRFGRVAGSLGYHEQTAMQQDGVCAIEKIVKPVFIVAVEIDPPHAPAVFEVDEEQLAIGQDSYLRYLAKVQECMATGKWPGPYEEVQRLELPAYVFADDDLEMTSEVIGGDKTQEPAQSDGPDGGF